MRRRPNIIGAPHNDGVTATVNQTQGSIGYIEYFFATSTNAQVAMLENAAGQFVAPSDESGQAALAGLDLTGKDLRIWVTDPADPAADPIVTGGHWSAVRPEGAGRHRVARPGRSSGGWGRCLPQAARRYLTPWVAAEKPGGVFFQG